MVSVLWNGLVIETNDADRSFVAEEKSYLLDKSNGMIVSRLLGLGVL